MPDSTWIHSGTTTAPTKMDKTFAWIRNHRDAVIGSLVITVAAAIFGIWVVLHYSGLRETAWKNLFIAQQTGYGGNYTEAAKQLDGIVTNYGRTSARSFAALTKGDLLFRQNKFKEAGEAYATLTVTGPKAVRPFALYNLAKTREASEDFAGAQAQYKDFLAAHPDHFLAPEVHFSLAEVYETMKNAAEAKTAYEKIALLYPETSWAMAAKAKIMPQQKPEAAGKTSVKQPQQPVPAGR